MTRTAPAAPSARVPEIDTVVQSPLWQSEPDAEATVVRAILAAAARCDHCPAGAEVAVVLSDDAAVQMLNRDWRGLDQPTNVLSFPAAKSASRDAPAILGDVVIAYETVAREAASEGKRFAEHLAHLAVHGFLHLLGYDHRDDEEAEVMERLEAGVLAELGISDPYAAAGHDPAAKRVLPIGDA